MFSKFNKRRILIIIISIAIAGSATFLQYRYVSGKQEVETIKVFTTAKKIKAGAKIDSSMLSVKEIPITAYSKSMIKNENDTKNTYVKVDIESNNYLIKDMLSPQEVAVIEEGMRIVTINTNMTSALAGRIKSGDYVDIGFISGGEEGDGKPEESKIIEEKVQIYSAVNSKAYDIEKIEGNTNQYDDSEKIPSAITFIVTPEQAVNIKDCESRGTLFLIGY